MVIKRKMDKEEIINRGGQVTADNEKGNEWTSLNLRIPKGLVKAIDDRRGSRIGISRTAWILEAIQEKMSA